MSVQQPQAFLSTEGEGGGGERREGVPLDTVAIIVIVVKGGQQRGAPSSERAGGRRSTSHPYPPSVLYVVGVIVRHTIIISISISSSTAGQPSLEQPPPVEACMPSSFNTRPSSIGGEGGLYVRRSRRQGGTSRPRGGRRRTSRSSHM